MKRMIRMIGIDLDGTLLTKNKELTDFSAKVLSRAVREGILVVPVTGRPFTGIPEKVLEIPGIRYVISSNGANTYDLADGQILRKEHLPHAVVRKVLAEASSGDVIREIFLKGVGYHDAKTQKMLEARFTAAPPIMAYINRSRKIVPDFEKLLSDESAHVENISLMFPSQEARDDVFERLKKIRASDGSRLLQILLPWRTDLEITHVLADKWRALRDLADDLGVPEEEIMTLGDGDNDRPMLRGAGLSVAMGNAPDFVRSTADYRTLDNEHDGAALAIEAVLDGRELAAGDAADEP